MPQPRLPNTAHYQDRDERESQLGSAARPASQHSLQVNEDVGADDGEGSPGGQEGNGVQALEEESPNGRGDTAETGGKRSSVHKGSRAPSYTFT